MAKNKEEKTNVMRILEQKKIAYTAHTYPHEDGVAVDGVTVAQSMGQDPGQVFKTLLARGGKSFYVFDIPVAEELDLKKA
ncbi:MAG: Cys-tRNA(Pro) deacylase, partial [Oscillospiraceae bacterium]|nr:Cys-tRNA(Pro) deacylase [Oscillospiraceae bacterium]